MLASHHAQLRQGKNLRRRIARSRHAEWQPNEQRADPLDLLAESNRGRIEALLPLRYGRMRTSPLAFLRGSAIVMTADLASQPHTGFQIPICGDCHLQNFGWFASPEREPVFDLTDFDEARLGPWEWDVKRLAASFVVAARRGDLSHESEAARVMVREYRVHMAEFAQRSTLDVWHLRLTERELLSRADEANQDSVRRLFEQARTKTVESLLSKLTSGTGTKRRFVESRQATPLRDDPLVDELPTMLARYRESLQPDRRELFDRFSFTHAAFKVVGVGSVGLWSGILLLLDPDGEVLLLQMKEARPSVLDRAWEVAGNLSQGERIVHHQRLMQAVSDPFLGWTTDQQGREFYVRQLRDMKLQLDLDEEPLGRRSLRDYARLCGLALARAHAKSGCAATISGYLGSSSRFEEAIGRFAVAYADQTKRDHERLTDAIAAGTLSACDEVG